ncbi:MAG: Fructose transport system ATP-binding protein [Frankiales bacterium]|jgi:fructose transport system ATP-binding protein|nr:Fructose transport system ATP-binding protein [Frankiales bacterium]
MTAASDPGVTAQNDAPEPATGVVLRAEGLTKKFGQVVGLAGVDLHVGAGEVLGVIGDNGAGKSTLINCLTGALTPDSGQLYLDGEPVVFRRPQDAREAGIETVYQTLGVAPALDIASNLFLGREIRRGGVAGQLFRFLDQRAMQQKAEVFLKQLGILTIQNMKQSVETLSGGQRQAIAVARAAAFGSKVVVLDEPTAALGVKESNLVLDMVRQLRDRGLGIVLVSHNMPNVWAVSDRIHVQRLGTCAAVLRPQTHTMSEGVAIMTGAAVV